MEHPDEMTNIGGIILLDLSGHTRVLTPSDSQLVEEGLAWAPSGKEIWFT
jgi:sugar lactone lactonase YvrE